MNEKKIVRELVRTAKNINGGLSDFEMKEIRYKIEIMADEARNLSHGIDKSIARGEISESAGVKLSNIITLASKHLNQAHKFIQKNRL